MGKSIDSCNGLKKYQDCAKIWCMFVAEVIALLYFPPLLIPPSIKALFSLQEGSIKGLLLRLNQDGDTHQLCVCACVCVCVPLCIHVCLCGFKYSGCRGGGGGAAEC